MTMSHCLATNRRRSKLQTAAFKASVCGLLLFRSVIQATVATMLTNAITAPKPLLPEPRQNPHSESTRYTPSRESWHHSR